LKSLDFNNMLMILVNLHDFIWKKNQNYYTQTLVCLFLSFKNIF
jgi:hypothetical protein